MEWLGVLIGMYLMRWRSDSCSLIMLGIDAVGEVVLPARGTLPPSRTAMSMVGTLETFIEERDIVTKKEPYESGKIDGRDKGPVLGVWELDLRSEFPLLFIPEKEVMVKIPHSEVIEKCSGIMSYFTFIAI